MKLFPFTLVLAVAVCVPVFSRAEVADGVKAVVAERVITFGEVEDITRPAADALRRQYAADPNIFQQKLNEALNDSLELLVQRALILHSFDTDGYRLPENFIEQLVQERIRDRFGDRVTLMKSLQQQGMTYEQFRKQIREQFIESQLRQQNVSREVVVSPFKIQNFYETHPDDFKIDDQVKLRMIVLSKTSETDTNANELAREIQTRLKDGAAFTELASVYSQGSQQHQGGDWGWVERNVLRKELGEIAFALKPGQVSDPIDASDAVYLMLVEDRKPAHAKPIAEVRSDIEKTLRAQQQAKLSKEWIDGLKKKTFIRYF
ncbi:MAG: Parvulin-like peptidyl-prolyl isomerase [Verrucomicrobiota bacterium]|jgi:parvulin-like peptidyl-prolyl isomerase